MLALLQRVEGAQSTHGHSFFKARQERGCDLGASVPSKRFPFPGAPPDTRKPASCAACLPRASRRPNANVGYSRRFPKLHFVPVIDECTLQRRNRPGTLLPSKRNTMAMMKCAEPRLVVRACLNPHPVSQVCSPPPRFCRCLGLEAAADQGDHGTAPSRH